MQKNRISGGISGGNEKGLRWCDEGLGFVSCGLEKT